MTITEKGNTLFSEIEKYKVLEIFSYVESSECDNLFNFLYGNRELTSTCEDMTVSEIARILAHMFYKKWDNLTLNYIQVEGIITGTKETNTISHKDGYTRTTITSSTAYNDDNFNNKDKTEEVYTPDSTNENITTKVSNTPYNIARISDLLTKNIIQDIIFKDVIETICALFIGGYEDES